MQVSVCVLLVLVSCCLWQHLCLSCGDESDMMTVFVHLQNQLGREYSRRKRCDGGSDVVLSVGVYIKLTVISLCVFTFDNRPFAPTVATLFGKYIMIILGIVVAKYIICFKLYCVFLFRGLFNKQGYQCQGRLNSLL